MLLQDAVNHFINAKRGVDDAATIKWYRARLKSLLDQHGETELKDITPEHLDQWRVTLTERGKRYTDHPTRSAEAGGLSLNTIHGYIRAVRTFFKFCLKRGYLDRDPAADLKRPRLPKAPPKHITDTDVDRLLRVATGRDRVVILVLADTGCRVGGLAGMTRDQIDLERGILHLQEKFNKTNEYYLTPQVLTVLHTYLKTTPPGKFNAVFASQNTDAPLGTTGIYQIIKRLAQKAGVTGRWNPHAFRHHKARELLENGASLELVAEILHHENIQTTAQAYGRWTQNEIQEKHRRYSRQDYPEKYLDVEA